LVAAGRFPQIYLPLIGVGVAALWPLTAYALSPLVLPATCALLAAVLVVLRRPEYGVAGALVLTPFLDLGLEIPGLGVSLVSPLNLILPALVGLVLAYGVLLSRGERESPESRRLLLAVFVFVAAILLATANAIDVSASISKAVFLLTAAMLFLATTQICRERSQLMVVVAGALVGLTIASSQGLVQNYSGVFSEGFESNGSIVGRVQGSFEHPNLFGGYIASLIPLASVIAFNRHFHPPIRWISVAALFLALPALYLSYSRASIVAVVLGAIVWLAFLRPRTAVLIAVTVAVASLALAPAALKERFDPERGQNDLSERVDLWKAAGEIYADHPLLGVGPNNFPDAYAELPPRPGFSPYHRLQLEDKPVPPPHAHNLYLNVLAEEGAVGAIALLLLLIAAISVVYRGCHVRDPAGRWICIGIGVGLMTLLANSFVNATLFTEPALPLFALLGVAAVLVGLDTANDRVGSASSGRS
jgi:O-antigen ligase